ncbi:MAG: zinc ribbon domain-containing protein [Candidatus Omnitrophota bacterium]
MPTYDYECRKCRRTFEVFQKMTDEPQKKCPKCGGKVSRLIGAGCGLIFKGSGFYITDYKRKDDKKQKQDNKDSKPPVPAAKEKTQESKSETKTKEKAGPDASSQNQEKH